MPACRTIFRGSVVSLLPSHEPPGIQGGWSAMPHVVVLIDSTHVSASGGGDRITPAPSTAENPERIRRCSPTCEGLS